MVVPVVLDKGQPSWELVDCEVVPVVPHLDLPRVVLEPLGLGSPMLGLGLVERMVPGNYLLELDNC